MTLAEQIIAFAGTGVGSLLIGWWINKKKEDIEITLKEQTFYKTLITDMEKVRKKEKEISDNLITGFKKEIRQLKDEIHLLIIQEKENKKNLEKWENYCQQLKDGLEAERKNNGLLFEENKKLKNQN